MSRWLEGRIAVVTGAARGIGRATAELFASEGARILLNDIDEKELEETTAAIRRAGGSAHNFPGDVTATGFPEDLLEISFEVFGIPDILVNNAGFTWDGTLHKMTDDQWQAVMDIHLTAPFRILRVLGAAMREAAKQEIEEPGKACTHKQEVQYSQPDRCNLVNQRHQPVGVAKPEQRGHYKTGRKRDKRYP